jgi:hypothetical protein
MFFSSWQQEEQPGMELFLSEAELMRVRSDVANLDIS